MKVYITLPQILKTLIFKPWHVFPAVQVVMWFKTFFIVRQWGKLQGLIAPFWACCSRLWHLCAWSKRTSCCCINLRFSGSAVGGWASPEPGWRKNKSPWIKVLESNVTRKFLNTDSMQSRVKVMPILTFPGNTRTSYKKREINHLAKRTTKKKS